MTFADLTFHGTSPGPHRASRTSVGHRSFLLVATFRKMSTNSGQTDGPAISQQSIPQKVMGRELAYYESRVGEDWDTDVVHTLIQWTHISAVYLAIMSEATENYRRILRKNTVINLIFSTIASTASLSTFNVSDADNPTTALFLKVLFSAFTVVLTISTGYIKVFQVQEKLETAIKLKQEWAMFGSKISSEMQLPVNLRKNAIWLIVKMKENYLELIKSDIVVSKNIIQRIANQADLRAKDLTLSQIFERIIKNEVYRIHGDEADFDDSDAEDESFHMKENKVKEVVLNVLTLGIRGYSKKIREEKERELLGKIGTLQNEIREMKGSIATNMTSAAVPPASSMPSAATLTVVKPMLRSSSMQPMQSMQPIQSQQLSLTPITEEIPSPQEDRSQSIQLDEIPSQSRKMTRVSSYIMKPIALRAQQVPRGSSGPSVVRRISAAAAATTAATAAATASGTGIDIQPRESSGAPIVTPSSVLVPVAQEDYTIVNIDSNIEKMRKIEYKERRAREQLEDEISDMQRRIQQFLQDKRYLTERMDTLEDRQKRGLIDKDEYASSIKLITSELDRISRESNHMQTNIAILEIRKRSAAHSSSSSISSITARTDRCECYAVLPPNRIAQGKRLCEECDTGSRGESGSCNESDTASTLSHVPDEAIRDMEGVIDEKL